VSGRDWRAAMSVSPSWGIIRRFPWRRGRDDTLISTNHTKVEVQLVEQRPPIGAKPPGIFNGGEVDQNIIHQTSPWLPGLLPMDDHLWRAPVALIGVRDSEPEPEGNGNRVGCLGHQLEHISGLPSS
jgi:hypothetical protein